MADGSEDKGLNCCLGRGNGNHIRLPGSPCPPASPSGQAVKHPLDPDTGDKTELQMAPVGSEVPVSHGPGALAWEIHHHLPHPQIHHHRPWAQSPAEQDGWVGGPVHDSQGCDGMGWDGMGQTAHRTRQHKHTPASSLLHHPASPPMSHHPTALVPLVALESRLKLGPAPARPMAPEALQVNPQHLGIAPAQSLTWC